MAANTINNSDANWREASNASAFKRSMAVAIADEVEVEFDNRFGTNPSYGIRGAAHTSMVTFINNRSDEELACVGRDTTDEEAVAFRSVVLDIVMAQPVVVSHQVDFVGKTSEMYRQITHRLCRDVASLPPTDNNISVMNIVAKIYKTKRSLLQRLMVIRVR